MAADSDTLARALDTLRHQEAKGRAKYGTDLDGAGLDALQLLTHATEEAADLLMYLTALQKAVAELRTSARCEYERFKDSVGQVAPLRARVAELEAELSATERTADAERERAKRAERLLESESARVAELEAENERLKAWVKATNPWGGECEDPAPTTRSGTGELLAEGRDYQIRTVGTVPEPPSPAPTTRPLTTADRLPQKGDGLRLTTTGWVLSSTDVRAWVDPSGQWVYPEQAVEYEYRADGGLVTVKVTP